MEKKITTSICCRGNSIEYQLGLAEIYMSADPELELHDIYQNDLNRLLEDCAEGRVQTILMPRWCQVGRPEGRFT